MKYQNFAVIFVIIILPISIVLSFYIQKQTDTIKLESEYQTKLNDSTYDAIASFQINSLNTSRVTGESVKSYVLASVNTFFTTLATNLGMSGAARSRLQAYVPAILFTTYDGYYIYSPLKTPEVLLKADDGMTDLTPEKQIQYIKDDGTTTTDPNDSDVNTVYNYMLKPFIYYSGEYKNGTPGSSNYYDVVASYTLDNYVTLYGTKKSQRENGAYGGINDPSVVTNEFSKSGYLIDPSKIEIQGDFLLKTVKRQSFGNSLSLPEPSESGSSTLEAIKNANSNPSSSTHNNVRFKTLSVNTFDDSTTPITNDERQAYAFINYILHRKYANIHNGLDK